MLVRTPAPMPTESLFGYILRVSETNGYDTPYQILNYAGYKEGDLRSSRFPVGKFAEILGRKTSELEAIAYNIIEKDGSRTSKILNHKLGVRLSNKKLGTRSPRDFLRLKKPVFCPQCVQEKKFIDSFWDLNFAVACPRHHCQLLDACPYCEKALGWYRPGLLTCNCSANLANADVEPASTSIVELMSIMEAKLHCTSTLNLPNTLGFPMQEMENQSLRSFMWITARLGYYNLFSKEIHETKGQYKTMEAASEVLSDWPSGYHRFLHQLGMKLTSNGNPSSIGLSKQFSKFYEPMFADNRKDRVASRFLRDEFVRFGLTSWGEATIDNKLLTSTVKETGNRFFSNSKIASILGISPVTLQKWLKKGLIPSKTIRMGNQIRYIVDMEAIGLFKRAPGRILNTRKAASLVGVPISILPLLKKLGHFIVENMPKHKFGFHEADLNIFSQNILQKSAMVTKESINNCSCISLDYILQKKKFWSDTGKAMFVAAYLDGEIRSIGRTGDSLKQIWFHEADVETLLNASRTEASDKTISQREAARIINCRVETIAALVEHEYLIGQTISNLKRLKHESVVQFSSLYVSLSSLAKQLNTSSWYLLQLCRKFGIVALCITENSGKVASFIKHEAQKELLKQVQLNPTRAQKRKIAKQKHINSLAKLKHYLNSLREGGAPLPRRGLIPNRRAITAACGIARDVFYKNPEAATMLDAFDAEERQLKNIKKRDDIGDLQHYLEDLKRNNAILPRLQNGQPNKVAVARACGFGKNIIYRNPDAAAILEKYATEMR
jgi:hypothetical protein